MMESIKEQYERHWKVPFRQLLRKHRQGNSAVPECSTSTSGSPTGSATEPETEFAGQATTPKEVALMELALMDTATNLSAHWAQSKGKLAEAAILHATIDELLDLPSHMEPDEWPEYFKMRDAVRALLGRPVIVWRIE